MRTLNAFTQITMDGYFTGPNGDLSWAHQIDDDAEFKAFVADNAKSGGALIFGRLTYEMMIQYWPTPQAAEDDPVVAERMNSLPKVVFSRTLKQASWANAKLVSTDPVDEVRKMKAESGKPITILGSGTLVRLLAQAGLIDAHQLVVFPVVLGAGRTAFEGIKDQLKMRLTKTRAFGNGVVLLSYASRS
jgi:dihydrofolate reductase